MFKPMGKVNLLVFGQLAFMLLSAYADSPNAVTQSTPRLTETAAIKIASDFCQRIGAVVENGTAVYPAPQTRTVYTTHWESRWLVTFHKDKVAQPIVEVVDSSGKVAFYHNARATQAPPKTEGLPETEPIDELQIMTRAQEDIAATGYSDELSMIVSSQKPRGDGHRLKYQYVDWVRVFDGIPYPDQGALATYSRATGALVNLSVNYLTPQPQSSVIKIMPSQATKIASQELATKLPLLVSKAAETDLKEQPAAGDALLPSNPLQDQNREQIKKGAEKGPDAFPVILRLAVSKPNNFWVIDKSTVMEPKLQAPRVVWIGSFQLPLTRIEVHIDVETGEVIAGHSTSGF